ncbi:homoserine kinase [Chelatococcus reniformis]|uniref:Homoserine kinase n=1 Tax=Chelatococcus reniformis TaxID=1494448 RepID=A0A916XQ16_9HYPH|nr:homoserine kinase [Chelatococcus reniformis]GGC91019.1 homoserine kinase [Chelatococcus reniformis]
MAVYTEVSDEELAAFVRSYAIGRVLAVKGIAEGVENSNFLLHTDSGFFLLTLYEKRVAEADLPFFLGLMEHVAARGITCPLPVKTVSGATLGRLAGRPAAIVTFLDGVSVRRPAAGHCAEVGRALAALHRAGTDFPLRRPNALSITAWPPLLQAAQGRADEVARGLGERAALALADVQQHWPARLPQGVVHADLFPDNVFFIDDRLSGLIDFYFACNDALAYDIAICLNAWCFETDGSFNVTKGRALLAGYEAVRPLSTAEVDALPVLCRGAALRFMLTRLVDWLNVPSGALVKPKDPLEYDRKLAFHMGAACASDYGLMR